jgi:hypothetical protein
LRIRAEPIRFLHGRTPPLLRWSLSGLTAPALALTDRPLSGPGRALTAILPQPARCGISFWHSSLQDMPAAGAEPATHPHVLRRPELPNKWRCHRHPTSARCEGTHATNYWRRLPTGDEGELVRLACCGLFQCVREIRAALVFLKISGNGRTPVRLGCARCREAMAIKPVQNDLPASSEGPLLAQQAAAGDKLGFDD